MFFDTLAHDPDRPPMEFKEGILTLTGNCMPENCDYTLGTLFKEIYDYLKYHDSLTLIFKFSNVNTTSSKLFLELFLKLNSIQKDEKKKIRVYWHSPHVDEDISELGEFYKEQSDKMAKKNKHKPLYFKLKYYNYE